MTDKAAIQQRTEILIQLTNDFSDKFLDAEYKTLCEKLIRKMARKKIVPFMTGRIEIWAAAVIHALGTINFLFDKSNKPYASVDDICQFFSTAKSTTGQKSKAIRDMFKLFYFDKDFSRADVKANDPFAMMRSNVFLDGMPIPLTALPEDLQKAARENPDQVFTLWTMTPEEQQ